MKGYDLDDTLARVDYLVAGQRGLANVFKSAKVIFQPTEDFIVITARPNDKQEYRTATLEWLRANEPHYKGIRYVSGSEEEIVKAKAAAIRANNLTSFTDNNTQILRKLKEILPASVSLYRMVGGKEKRF